MAVKKCAFNIQFLGGGGLCVCVGGGALVSFVTSQVSNWTLMPCHCVSHTGLVKVSLSVLQQ